MTYEEALSQLANHANLPGPHFDSTEHSIVHALWRANRIGMPPELAEHVREIVSLLSVVNRFWNGETPSGVLMPEKPMALDRDVVYSVHTILSSLVHYHLLWRVNQTFSQAALGHVLAALWVIGEAWSSVLAGDEDDLNESIRATALTNELTLELDGFI